MASSVVPDTSVILKWFRQGEILAREALELRAAYLDGRIRILAPDLLAYELANVLRYKRELGTGQVEDAIESLFDMGLVWVAPSSRGLRRAAVIAREADITVYDASFVAAAEAHDATFVTADERLAQCLTARYAVQYLGAPGGW